MALLDNLSPRFAVARSEAHAVIRRMVRVFFAPTHWEKAERQVDDRFSRQERYSSVEGETGGPYDQKPALISWKPYEQRPDLFAVEVFTRQFGHHLVDIIAMERSVGRKVQPLPQGFRLDRSIKVERFESLLGQVLGCPVDLAGHLRWLARMRLVLELLGGRGGNEAAAYHQWLRTLPTTEQARLRAAHDFVWSKRKGREIVGQMEPSRAGLAQALTGLLREGGGLPAPEAATLAGGLLEQFPTDLDWQAGSYAPLRIPIETDWLEVDCSHPLGVRDGLPYVPEGRPAGPVELILHPNSSQPLLSGVYDRQCLMLDAVDEIRRAFGLAPDARYEHYRSHAMQDPEAP